MNKIEIKNKVVEKVNAYLFKNRIIIEGEHPTEEYTSVQYANEIVRNALDIAFYETYKLCNKK